MADDNQALLLQVSADIRGLEKAFDRAVNKVKRGSKDMEDAGGRLESFFGKPNIPKALDKVFDATRFKILDSGAARVGLFGSALELLGPAGIVAAGGIIATAVALNEAHNAMTFAHDLESTANRLHVTTDALQEYRYAILKAGGDEKSADEALGSFSETLGRAQEGLGRAKKAFNAIGFSDAEIKGWKTADEALQAVTKRVAELKSLPQKDAVIAQLGLEGLKPVIESGLDKMQDLKREAHAVGFVMSEDLVKRGAEAGDKFEILSKVISIQLKSAFVDLGPTLVSLVQAAADLARQVADIADSFKSIENRRTSFLTDSADKFQSQVDQWTSEHPMAVKQGKIPGFVKQWQEQADKNRAELSRRWDADHSSPPIPTGSRTLIDQGNGAEKAAQQLKHFNDMMAKDAEAILAAMDNERHSAEERADIARKRLDAEETARAQELKDQVATGAITAAQADILATKDKEVFAVKRRELNAQLSAELEAVHLKAQGELTAAVVDALRSQADLAKTAAARALLNAKALAEEQAQARKEELKKLADDPNKSTDQKAAELGAFDQQQANAKASQAAKDAQAIADEALSVQTAGLDSLTDALQAQLAIATTAKARRDLELRLLDLADQEAKARLEAVLASQTATDAEKQIAQKQLDTLNATAPDRRQAVIRETNGPLADYIDKLPTSLDQVNERMQALAVDGIEGLNSAILDLATGTGKASDVLRNFVLRMLSDFAQLELQHAEGSLLSLGASLFGGPSASSGGNVPGLSPQRFANGGNPPVGVPSIVGERGPEIIIPRSPMTVIPNHAITKMGGQTVVVQEFHLHAEGAVMTDQLVTSLDRKARQYAAAARVGAVQDARRGAPGYQRSYAKLGTV